MGNVAHASANVVIRRNDYPLALLDDLARLLTRLEVLSRVHFAVLVLVEVGINVATQRGGIAGDFATLQTIPDGDVLVVRVNGRVVGLYGRRLRVIWAAG